VASAAEEAQKLVVALAPVQKAGKQKVAGQSARLKPVVMVPMKVVVKVAAELLIVEPVAVVPRRECMATQSASAESPLFVVDVVAIRAGKLVVEGEYQCGDISEWR